MGMQNSITLKTEKQLQDYTKKQAKLHGIGYYKLHCVGQTGFPDVLLTYKGYCIFIELKTPVGTSRLSERQCRVLNQLTDQDMETYVIDQPEQIDTLIAKLTNRKSRSLLDSLI